MFYPNFKLFNQFFFGYLSEILEGAERKTVSFFRDCWSLAFLLFSVCLLGQMIFGDLSGFSVFSTSAFAEEKKTEEKQAEPKQAKKILTAEVPLRIGAAANSQSFFEGELADPVVYDRPLVEREIAALIFGDRPKQGLIVGFDSDKNQETAPSKNLSIKIQKSPKLDNSSTFPKKDASGGDSLKSSWTFDGTSYLDVFSVKSAGADSASDSGTLLSQRQGEPATVSGLTLACWIKLKNDNVRDGSLIDKMTSGTNRGFLLDLYGGLRFLSNAFSLTYPEPLPSGRWIHVAATYCAESDTANLWINGNKYEPKDVPNNPNISWGRPGYLEIQRAVLTPFALSSDNLSEKNITANNSTTEDLTANVKAADAVIWTVPDFEVDSADNSSAWNPAVLNQANSSQTALKPDNLAKMSSVPLSWKEVYEQMESFQPEQKILTCSKTTEELEQWASKHDSADHFDGLTLQLSMIPQTATSSVDIFRGDKNLFGKNIHLWIVDELIYADVDGKQAFEYWTFRPGQPTLLTLIIDKSGVPSIFPDNCPGPLYQDSRLKIESKKGSSEHSRVIWSEQPGKVWTDSYPLGNGRLGAQISGGVSSDILFLNEETLWGGMPNHYQRPEYLEALPEIRQLIFDNKFKEADKLGSQKLLADDFFENYLPFGTLVVKFDEPKDLIQTNLTSESNLTLESKLSPKFDSTQKSELKHETESTQKSDSVDKITDYRRSLDLKTATGTSEFCRNGVQYRREAFVSYPDQAVYYHVSGDQKGTVSLTADIRSFLRSSTVPFDDSSVRMDGFAPKTPANGHGTGAVYKNDQGIRFSALLKAFSDGGTVSIAPDGKIIAKNCDSVTLVLTMETSFNGPDKNPVSEGKDAFQLCLQTMNQLTNDQSKDSSKIADTFYSEARQRHIDDYQKLFDRMELSFGDLTLNNNNSNNSDNANDLSDSDNAKDLNNFDNDNNLNCTADSKLDFTAVPTRKRAKNFKLGTDNDLIALYAQFGRYLLISCSRPGTYPSNLQGIWNHNINAKWASNYTTNCNVEINYWPVEVGNLSECHLPMEKMIQELLADGARTAKICYGVNGWTVHHNIDLWRTTTPVAGSVSWAIFPIANAWLTQHLVEHYRFTGDKDFMRRNWNALKGAAVFQMESLQKDPQTGLLLLNPDLNFENGFRFADGSGGYLCAGSTPSMLMLRQLLENVIYVSEELEIELDFRQKAQETLDHLIPIPVNEETGELKEWAYPYVSVTDNSQMLSTWGLVCSDQISLQETPELAVAMEKMIDGRRKNGLAERTGSWQGAFQIMSYARLGRADDAADIIQRHLQLIPNNNMTAGFIGDDMWEIDGNLGQTAGIFEMLIQSQTPEIILLPALPDVIPSGSVRGICARNGFELDFSWKDGELTSLKVRSKLGKKCSVRFKDKVFTEEEIQNGI